MPKYAQTDHLGRWDTALAAGAINDTEPGTVDLVIQLGTAAAGARNCLDRRATLKYQLQQNSRELDGFMDAGKEAYSRLVLVVKGRYGPKAEKVVEWGVQPRRPSEKSKLVPPPLEEGAMKKPPEKGQSPTQAAHSQTESTN
ncbi:MAG TPA: hypothetical protein VF179_27685 [Thermoanaerobaculia bacterium]|nr:hypothetical protein [Thermoanaerobaculia bacterium]